MTSTRNDENDTSEYVVLINAEEQYSLWLSDVRVPEGWTRVSGPAPKAECVAYVDRVWTDMRPRSLRERDRVAAEATASG
jgi:uncharacterized protein YbdZ (MbtH family)